MRTEEEIKQEYLKAPQYIQDYIDSDELFFAFHEIRKAHNMHVDHAGGMALAIDAVILGMEPLERFPDLMKEVMPGVDGAAIARIVADVNEKVFVVFRKMAEEKATRTVIPQPTPPPLTPPPAMPALTEVEKVVTAEPPPVVVTKSILETNMPKGDVPVAPPSRTLPEPAQPRYHGTDPYREMPE